MNDNIERALFHGVGVVNYFNKNSPYQKVEAQKYLDEIDKILDFKADDRDLILDYIKKRTENFVKSDIAIRPTQEQLDYLNSINDKKLDKPFINEMNRIRKILCKFRKTNDIADAKDILFKLSSFAFCHTVKSDHDESETVMICEDVFYYLNLIEYLFPALKENVNTIKEQYFSLYYSYIVKNYFADVEDEEFDIVSLIMDFNLNDVDSLLGLNYRLYPTSFNDDLLNKLDAEQDMELYSGLTTDGEHKFFGDDPADGQGSYLQFVLMNNGGIFRDNYESLYKKFMYFDISNMYLYEAMVAQYNNKKSQGKMLLKYVVEDRINENNIPVYEELKAAFAAPGRTMFKSKDFSAKIATLLLDDGVNFSPNILADLDNPLTPFCMHHMIGDILDDTRFNANDIEFLLISAPKTIRGYLMKPAKFIFKKDISELYKMSVYLLNIDMLVESRMIIIKLIEMSKKDEDLFNEDETKIIVNQLKLVELSLEYKK